MKDEERVLWMPEADLQNEVCRVRRYGKQVIVTNDFYTEGGLCND